MRIPMTAARFPPRGKCRLGMPLCMLLSVAMTTHAQDDPHAAHRAAMQRSVQEGSQTAVELPGTQLRMRDGSALQLDRATLGERVVVVDFVYTHCTTICPALTALMAAVQRKLQEQGQRDWLLISISVDPLRDTPTRMDAYAGSVGAGAQWWWLTGDSAQIERTLRAFGIAPGKPEDHAPIVLVGRPAHGQWRRWVGMPAPAKIVEAVQALRQAPADKRENPHAH